MNTTHNLHPKKELQKNKLVSWKKHISNLYILKQNTLNSISPN